jgi:hypothetical protein
MANYRLELRYTVAERTSFEACCAASPLVFDGVTINDTCARSLAEAVVRENARLASEGKLLFPTGAHPFSDPGLWEGAGLAVLTVPPELAPYAPAVLPLLPAVAASSPFLGGIARECSDTRLETHPHDRALLAFDLQECPAADTAIASATIALLVAIAEGKLGNPDAFATLDMGRLQLLQEASIKEADMAICEWPEYLQAFRFAGKWAMLADLWDTIEKEVQFDPLFVRLLHRGPLARTLSNWLGHKPTESLFLKVYAQIDECLQKNEVFF